MITLLFIAQLCGAWLAKLTTRQPDDSQIEVAIASLKAVLPEYAEETKVEEEASNEEVVSETVLNETPEENKLQEKITND